jgi:hypothetical protein
MLINRAPGLKPRTGTPGVELAACRAGRSAGALRAIPMTLVSKGDMDGAGGQWPRYPLVRR